MDVVIEIKPILTGPKHEFSNHMVYVPHLNKQMELSIPNWIEVGHSIRISGKGKTNKAGETGDLLFKIIEIQCNDIEVETQVTLHGPKNSKTTVNIFIPETSNMIALDVPNNTKEGTVFRIYKKGLVDENGNHGNLFIRIDKITSIT